MPTLIVGKKIISFEGGAPSVVIPDYIEEIADNAFYECGYIADLTLPDGVREIGNYAFKMCYSMKSIALPKMIDHMGSGVFQQCWALGKVILPSGTSVIGNDMFSGCRALADLTIPDTVEEIDRIALAGCVSLRRLRIDPSRLEILPAASRATAVLTYMSEHHGDTAANDVIDGYAEKRSRLIADLAINHNEQQAIHYMTSHGILQSGDISDYIDKATGSGRTEIAAMLLEEREATRTGEDDFEWDPFA